jgi:hypothetical protein
VRACALALAGLLCLGIPFAGAADDVVVLLNGDRITGKLVAKGTKLARLQTPYGLLVIGLDKIDRIRHADGWEEVVAAPPKPPVTPATPPPPPPLRVILIVAGKTFWQAWDASAAPADATLRLELRLDDRPLVSYLDATLDPGEISKAVVNSFSFTADSLRIVPGPGVKALAPEVKPGRILLPLEMPAALAGSRRLRLAYQRNDGTVDAPQWRDLALSEVTVPLQAAAPTTLRVEQDRGSMEFSKHRMKNVETFQLAVKLDTPSPEP